MLKPSVQIHDMDGILLADSYHVSRLNTNTGRLTAPMFEAVVADIKAHRHDWRQ